MALYTRVKTFRSSDFCSSRWRITAMVVVFFVLAWFLTPYETKAVLLQQTSITACNLQDVRSLTCDVDSQETRIPNIVHYVYILADPSKDFPLQFSHFLSVYAAWYRWRPDTIYLHTNIDADSPAVARAKDGSAGKWAKLIFNMPGFTVNKVPLQTHAGNGRKIKSVVHQADFARVKALHDIGGTYIDMDVHALRNTSVLREMGWGGVGGRQLGGALNSGTFMSEKGGKMIKGWMDRMNEVYDGGWTTHSNAALTSVGESLTSDGCDMLILAHDGFAPGGWTSGAVTRLFGSQGDESTSNLPSDFAQGDSLSSYDVNLPNGFSGIEEDAPEWAKDWSCTFLMHAFAPDKPRHGVTHNNISPRSVLERRSNFARAVYPVAKAMYDEGIIDIDDTDLGR